MKFPFVRSLLATLLLAAGLAHAADDEAKVKKNLESFLNAPAVESVKKTPYGGLFEVVLKSGELLYTDASASFIIDGNIIDAKTRKNVTQARMLQLMKIDFATLPLDQAIKQVRGNGKRVIASFEDPNCGFCKKLAKDLQKLDNVTIYTFLYPILSPDSLEKSNRIWCSANKSKSWNDWMIDGKEPEGRSDCDTTAVRRTVELGHQLGINGTPTLFFTDGERIPGAVPLAQIEKKLEQLGSGKP